MSLSKLTQRQIAADRRRGFAVDFEDDTDRLTQLEKDLIGLLGEVGEFANLLKKVRLKTTHANYDGPSLVAASVSLREELADATIYILRLSAILNTDLESDIVNKMKINDERYQNLE